MNQIGNEQTKLTANFLNGLAIALFAVGVIAPVISALYGSGRPSVLLAVVSAVCFLVALAIHLAARRILRSLE